jgi:hypothetical protein
MSAVYVSSAARVSRSAAKLGNLDGTVQSIPAPVPTFYPSAVCCSSLDPEFCEFLGGWAQIHIDFCPLLGYSHAAEPSLRCRCAAAVSWSLPWSPAMTRQCFLKARNGAATTLAGPSDPPAAKKVWQKSRSADQKNARYQRVAEPILARRHVLRRQGVVVESWRYYQQRRLGPYFRVSFREQGRQESIYLGPLEAALPLRYVTGVELLASPP